MFPESNVVLPILGVLFSLGCVFVVAELLRLRAAVGALQEELRRIRTALKRRDRELFGAELTSLESAAVDLEHDADWRSAPASAPPSTPHPPRVVPLVGFLRRIVTGGNTLVRAGVVILFFGVAFLLRYAAEHSHLPIELRMAGIALGGLALLAAGWVLRRSRPGYALALQGGAVGILYLTLFAALRLYALLPPQIAFTLLVVVAALSAALALLQDSLAFALLAIIGGFLAPLLAAQGQGNHVVLFGYYAVLNAGIVAMSWFKSWRPLNRVGFLFTFAIATGWGVLRYRMQDFSSTEPFLLLFFLFYVAIAVLFTLRQPPHEKPTIDGTSVFGVPIVVFGLQSGMLHEHVFALAFSAVAMSTAYLCVAWWLKRRNRPQERLLLEAFMALGVVFFTLAIPLALDGRWNVAAWALEGSALIWAGCRQQRRLPRVFGAILILAAGVVIMPELGIGQGAVLLPQGLILSVVLLAVAAVFSANSLHSNRSSLAAFESWLPPLVFAWGVLWWGVTGSAQLQLWIPAAYFAAAELTLFAVTAILASEISRRTSLSFAAEAALLLLPLMVGCAINAALSVAHPFSHGGAVAWPLAFAAFYHTLSRHDASLGAWRMSVLHSVPLWLLCALLGWEVHWDVDSIVSGSQIWPESAAILPTAFVMYSLPWLIRVVAWPLAAHRRIYWVSAGAGLAAALAFWSVAGNLTVSGDAQPLPYAPLLNPFDSVQVLVLISLARYWMGLRRERVLVRHTVETSLTLGSLVAIGFLFANGVLLRTLHQWAGVPLVAADLLESTLVQTALSIFWTVLALATMLLAASKHARQAWMVGAGLMVIVVLKLFLIDLSRVGSVERIISFVGVGVLMLVVGYWSPIPPSAQRSQ